MTVRELIKALQKQDPDKEVHCVNEDSEWTSINYVNYNKEYDCVVLDEYNNGVDEDAPNKLKPIYDRGWGYSPKEVGDASCDGCAFSDEYSTNNCNKPQGCECDANGKYYIYVLGVEDNE